MGRAFDLTIGNLATREYIVTQFTPTKITEELSSEIERIKVLGLPHQPMQYSGTANHKLSVSLEFMGSPAFGQTAAQQRRFLLANHYPSRSARGFSGATGIAGILFDWPNLFSLVCAQLSVKIEHELFNPDGSSRRFTAQLAFEEIRDVKLFAEDVVRVGTLRR